MSEGLLLRQLDQIRREFDVWISSEEISLDDLRSFEARARAVRGSVVVSGAAWRLQVHIGERSNGRSFTMA